MKRTELRRGSTPLERRTRLVSKGRLSYRSAKREAEVADRFVVRAAVFARDRHTCQMPAVLVAHDLGPGAAGPCFGPLSVHHLLKASQGGAYSLENALALCIYHNDYIEDHPALAHMLGLVIRHGD